MRADRLLTLMLLLQARERMTAAQLAERLEVSERTIYRDLDALSAAGVPVYADRGPGGGCALRRGYRTDLTGLNRGDVASLFAGTSGGQLAELGLGPGFQSALAKLEAGLPGERRGEAEHVRARFHVDAAPWFAPRESTRQLPALRDALLGDRPVRLTTRRDDGRESTRVVLPLGLVVKGGIWYLVALAGAETRVYRVSRLRRVAAAKETMRRPPNFDLAAFWARWSRDFIAGIPEYPVTLRVRREALPILPHVLGERIRETIAAAGRPKGRGLIIEFNFDDLEAACGRVLSLGTLVEVLEPAELRQRLRQEAEAVARQYGRRS